MEDCPATQMDISSSSSCDECPRSDECSLNSVPCNESIGSCHGVTAIPAIEALEVASSEDEISLPPRPPPHEKNWLAALAAASTAATKSESGKKRLVKQSSAVLMPSEIRPARCSAVGLPGTGLVRDHPAKRSRITSVAATSERVGQPSVVVPVALSAVHKERTEPVRRSRRIASATPLPSFAFLANETAKAPELQADMPQQHNLTSSDSSAAEVEAFVTMAGRAGKGGSLTQRITVEEIQQKVPVTFIPNLVPTEFADHLLRTFMGEVEAKRWHTSKRWLYDKEIESHRLESGFRFDSNGRVGGHRWESAGFSDDLRHLRFVVAGAVQRARADLRSTLRATRQAMVAKSPTICANNQLSESELAQETVAIASRGQRLGADSVEWLMKYAREYKQVGWRWEPNFCVANYYVDEGDFLGAHSDPVESLGPWAIVASLTFGAARQFRIKPVGTVRASAKESDRITSYSIRLPHNSLLIMWEGFQEFWRHEVPKDKGLARHAISGAARLNFTLRKSVSMVARRRPLCQCGRKTRLKPVLKETSRNRGRYFWSCSNPRVRKGEYAHCEFFKWDDELVVEGSSSSTSASSAQTGGSMAHRGPNAMQASAGQNPRVASSPHLIALRGRKLAQGLSSWVQPQHRPASTRTPQPLSAHGGA